MTARHWKWCSLFCSTMGIAVAANRDSIDSVSRVLLIVLFALGFGISTQVLESMAKERAE